MAGRTRRAALALSEDQAALLRRLAGSRTAAVREVERARILLGYAQGMAITDLARRIGVSRPAIYACLDKALAAGVAMGLRDAYHRPHEPEIGDEARATGRERRRHQAHRARPGRGAVVDRRARPVRGRPCR